MCLKLYQSISFSSINSILSRKTIVSLFNICACLNAAFGDFFFWVSSPWRQEWSGNLRLLPSDFTGPGFYWNLYQASITAMQGASPGFPPGSTDLRRKGRGILLPSHVSGKSGLCLAPADQGRERVSLRFPLWCFSRVNQYYKNFLSC